MSASASPANDPLVDRLAISVVSTGVASTATTVTSATKTPASMPLSMAALLNVCAAPAAAHTLDVKIQGRNKATDAWTDVVTFAQVTNASSAAQRANLPNRYGMYQAVVVSAGAFGAGQTIAYTVVLVGTDVMNAPIVQS